MVSTGVPAATRVPRQNAGARFGAARDGVRTAAAPVSAPGCTVRVSYTSDENLRREAVATTLAASCIEIDR